MCGGTWPLDRGELSTRTDKHFSLDGADDLIDAAFFEGYRNAPLSFNPSADGSELFACPNDLLETAHRAASTS
jgi:hypothetical protein